MSKYRLLIFHPTIAPYRIDFFNSLCQLFNTRICLFYRNLKSQTFNYNDIEKQFDFKPIYLQKRFKIGHFQLYRGYWDEIRKYKPNIVMVNEFGFSTISTLIYKWLFNRKLKIVSISDDSYNMVAENNDFSWSHHIARRVIVPFLDNLILVDHRVVEWFQQHYHQGIYFPIIQDEMRLREAYIRVAGKAAESINIFHLKDKYIFLFVGRLVALKNVSTIISAFDKVATMNTSLVIVGDGPERAALQNQAEMTGKDIVFTGRLEGDELLQWYNIANCFILASYKEPFGCVTNEALVAGCWCLISSMAGSGSLIKEGVNGEVFNPMDEGTLAIKMKEAYESRKCYSITFPKDNLMQLSYKERMESLTCELQKC